MSRVGKGLAVIAAVVGALGFAGSAAAEGRISIAQQFGIGYLILDERLSLSAGMACAAVLVGVSMIIFGRR